MRISRAIWSAAAGAAVVLILSAPLLRADEFNKMTYLTFSGPVQVPGVVLPAGEYMFKLADPETGRRVIQIWDKEGTHLHTMLLSIPDQQAKPSDDPVVLFRERPAGEPQAIKSWFYPGESSGYEFVYPKDQATKLAAANHESVLAQSTPMKSDADIAAYSKSSVGRVSDTGQFEEQTASASTTTATTATTTADQSQGSRTPERDQQTAAAVGSDRDQQSARNQDQVARNNDQSAPAAPPPSTATQPSANRTDAGVNRSDTTTTAQSQTTTSTTQDRPSAQSQGNTTANQTATSDRSARNGNRAVGTSGELPKTASNGPFVQLMAGLTLIAAAGMRQLRKRMALSRS